MPTHIRHPCAFSGCPTLVATGQRYCSKHAGQQVMDYERNRPTSTRRGYDAEWQRLRLVVLARDPLCVDPFGDHPGQPILAEEVDHKIPLSKGGGNNLENLQSLCKSCHSKKTAIEDGRWTGGGAEK